MRRSGRRLAILVVTLFLAVSGGGCLTESQQAAAPDSPTPDTPAVLGSDQPSGPLYGVVWQEASATSHLSRLDPRTLLPVAGERRLALDRLAAWTISPDRSVAVFGPGDSTEFEPDDSSVHLMDLDHMRQAAVVRTKAAVGVPRGARWLAANTVLLLGHGENYETVERAGVTSVVARPTLVATIIDTTSRRVIAQRTYDPVGEVVAVEPARDGLVVLFQPAERIGTAQIGRMDAQGRLHVVPLNQVTAGRQRPVNGGDVGSREVLPGLAVDAAGGRAYVVVAGSPVAQVAIADLRVTYHSLVKPGGAPSVLGLLRRALMPVAEAKMQSGPVRHALWLGGGRLAVWGTDSDFRGENGAATGESRPSGLQVIDTSDWSVRTLDPGIGRVVRAENRLITAGTTVRNTKDGTITKGDGLRIRTPGTRRPVHLYAARPLQWFQAYGPYVYVDLTDPTRQSTGPAGYAVIDTRTGTVIGEHKGSHMPYPLQTQPG